MGYAEGQASCLDQNVYTQREMRIAFLPHALEQMQERSISEEEARQVLEEPDEEGEANFGRIYAQKVIGHRRIRVVYNRGADEIVAVSVMLRRREGGRS